MTIGLKAVENPLEFGIVVTDEDGTDRALPREAVVGAGLLGHDQHRHLRARARGAPARADRPAVRLLEGALPAAARDGAAAVRDGLRRLLAGHRQPRPVPAGELRRARRHGRRSTSRASACAGTSGSARASRSTTSRTSRGRRSSATTAGSRRRRRSARTRCSRPSVTLRERARTVRSVIDAEHAHRPQRARRGRDPRPRLRRPLARPHPRGRGDRRRGRPRRAERRAARRADLPVQGGRVRRAHPREPDLGVAGDLGALRQGRRLRPDQRRPDARRRPSASPPRSARR